MLSYNINKMVDLSLKNLYDLVMELICSNEVTMQMSVKDLLQVIINKRAELID